MNADGSLDASFDTTLGANSAVQSLVLQADGRILVAGNFTTYKNVARQGIARLNNTITNVPVNNPALRIADFDGDGKSDASVFRAGTWFIRPSGGANFADSPQADYAVQFGAGSDKLAPADFDGDGKTDIAVWREAAFGYFYILQSADNTFRAEQFGTTGDSPIVAGNWDADGKADLAVYRSAANAGGQSYFYYRPSSQPSVNFVSVQWGTAGDEPVRGDFDGDGKLDAAVYRAADNVWYIRQSGDSQLKSERWGLAADKRVFGDFDGDGKTDLAIYRDGLWAVLQSSNSASLFRQWGAGSDKLVAGDYDGDGKTDFAVFRSGVYYVLNNASGQSSVLQFGAASDTPIASAFVR